MKMEAKGKKGKKGSGGEKGGITRESGRGKGIGEKRKEIMRK
jgi:hypothetical protein